MTTTSKQIREHLPSKTRDRIGGFLVAATGVFVSIEALSYSFGKISRMGPGMIPFGLGLILDGPWYHDLPTCPPIQE